MFCRAELKFTLYFAVVVVIETRPNEVKINFTAEMQRSLQEAFEEAFTRQQLTPFGYIWRQKRQQHKRHQDKIMVQVGVTQLTILDTLISFKNVLSTK